MKERVGNERIAVVNEKLEPKLQDARNRQMNVMCISRYPAIVSFLR